MSAATYASITRSLNPDDDFILYGEPPYYIERTTFHPTNSDLTSTTRNLSQHEYRADVYKDVLDDDRPLRGSLRNMSRILQRVSSNISKSLLEDSTAKGALSRAEEPAGQESTLQANGTQTAARDDDRNWLTDSEWYTTSGHHVTFRNNFPTTSTFRPNSGLASPYFYEKTSGSFSDTSRSLEQSASHSGDVPLTRFTRKDLLASKYFPITMGSKTLGGEKETHRRSRSRTRTPRRRRSLSSEGRSSSHKRTTTTDNYQAMKGLEKLYTVASEAPGIASATIAIMSPYQEEMARLRLERLRLEGEHLKELKRLSELEKMRGPKPKWYELKDTRFHYEAQKNNELLRSQDRCDELMKEGEILTRASEDFQKSLASGTGSLSAMSA